VTFHNHHKETDELYSTLHTDKDSVMVIVEVLGCSRSVLFGRHECWQVHTHTGKESSHHWSFAQMW